jgi:hypothetical protein
MLYRPSNAPASPTTPCAETPVVRFTQTAPALVGTDQPDVPDNAGKDNTRAFDDEPGRAPNHVPAVLASPPSIAEAHDDHRRHALPPVRISSGHGIDPSARNTTD